MKPRFDYQKAAQEPLYAMFPLGKYLTGRGSEANLLDLMRLRASQINGCAKFLDMHPKDARAAGETKQRLYTLRTWRETPFFSERERAALAWAEAETRIAEGVAAALFQEARKQFSEKELTDLTWAVAAINAWNRIAISFRLVPGNSLPGKKPE
jgi:AhpD family alkylhydroperoxidase